MRLIIYLNNIRFNSKNSFKKRLAIAQLLRIEIIM